MNILGFIALGHIDASTFAMVAQALGQSFAQPCSPGAAPPPNHAQSPARR